MEELRVKRRSFLAGSATAALVRPSLAQPALGGHARTLTYVPQANLTSLDPVWTTALVTRNCAAMIFETLYGRDEKLNPKPQMVEGHQVENDGLRWTMRLRDGLLFHDGTPVLARDCVASLLRWMNRDPIGQSIADRMDALEASDDSMLVFRLNKPFASLPSALAKTQPTPVIMPERLAKTDPFKQIPEAIGSGGVVLDYDAPLADWVAAVRRLWNDNREYDRLSGLARSFAGRPELDPDRQFMTFFSILDRAMQQRARQAA